MRTWVNEFLRIWVKWSLTVYFSKIEVEGRKNVPVHSPLIIIANHQNALLDPLLIATFTGIKPYFLARADLFKNPFLARLLSFIQLIPVFRIRDGLSSISGNQESFSQCESLLADNQVILLFPEGNHSLRRNVRPLSKGFTRIAYGAIEKHRYLPLSILPIGISYESHQQVGAAVRIEIGEPILVSSYHDDPRGLTRVALKALKKLTVHIPEEGYEGILDTLKANHIPLTSPKKVRNFLSGQYAINQSISDSNGMRKMNWVTLLFHWPLWLLWKAVKNSIKDPVFYGTFKFTIGLVVCPLYYFLLILLSWMLGYGIFGLLFVLVAFFSLMMYTKI